MIARIRLRSLVILLGLLVAVGFALVVPAGYFAVFYAHLHHDLDFAARSKASRLASFIADNRESWQRPTDRLSQVIAQPEAGERATRQRVFDAGGRAILQSGEEKLTLPLATVNVPVVVGGSKVASVEMAASLDKLLEEAALVALASGLVGLSVFFLMRGVPLRAIDRTLGQLENAQERYRRLFNVSPVLMVVLDRQTRRVLDANEATVRQYGWSHEELLTMSSNDFYPPEDLPDVLAQRERFMADPNRVVPPLRHRKKDGTIIDVEQTILPIDYDGKPALLVTANDVTERNRAMRELRESEQRYQALVETLPVGVLETTTDGRIVTANLAWRHMFGFGDDEDLGKLDVRDLYANPDDRGAVVQLVQAEGAIPATESVFRRRDGTIFPVERYLRSVRDETGMVTSLRGIVIDITQRKSLEAQLHQAQKMEAVGQLTGGVAHDFNNILMIVMAGVDALEEEKSLSQAARRRVDQISRAIDKASDLTRSLLAFSHKLPLLPQRVDLNALVLDVGRLLQRTLGTQVEIESMLGKDLWPVEVDRGQLENALVNLCVNARDAMPDGGRVLIETRNVVLDGHGRGKDADLPPGAYVRLSVTDTGEGIAAEVLPRVFDPFFTTKEVGKGTGLGLSMVHGFIIQSHGHIAIQSERGRGTSITIHLPRAADLADEGDKPVATDLPRGRERILVVEDESHVGDAVVEQLQSLGYAVTQAADGSAGLAAFETAERPYDLLLTDIVMPGLNGKKLADEVAARWPGTSVLFMSGYRPDNESRLDPGARLLTKPFHKSDLATAVRKALDTR
ncbi:PAS domain S-box-containing protein [Rhodospirillales bacterium URHD0017]|nr:PAS domain S-box-containing protein [Rhodospirillales bacterium URHD0017]